MRHDIGQIAKMLAARAEDVCRLLLPDGKRRGNEWRAGSVQGGAGDSLGVNLAGKAGTWRDFAADERGGDLIDLFMACRGISKAEAVNEAKEFLGIRDEQARFTPKPRSYKLPDKPQCKKPVSAAAAFFETRKIGKETVEAFKIGENGNIAVFPYFHGETLKFVKFRDVTDKAKMWSSADSEPILFGWQAMPADQRFVVLTEGEIDAMSFYEHGIPALSVPRGGGDGGKQEEWIACEWNNLQLFDTVYLALDADEQGDKAAECIAQRVGRHRCKRVSFGRHKDANEAMMAGEDLRAWLNEAKPCDPPELRAASDYIDEVVDFFGGKEDTAGYCLPWFKTHHNVRLRKSEISVWGGYNGHGKSQVLGHVVVSSIWHGEKWCAASMEFKPFKLLARMFRQAGKISCPSEPVCRNKILPYFEDSLFLFDLQGTAKADRILEVFEYAFRRYGCTSFLVDSLAKCGFGEDDYNGQKAFVDRLMEFSQRFDVHVHLVCHARKGTSEDDAPGKMDIKGTSAITDMVDNVFTVWRNKAKERAKHEFARTHVRTKDLDAPDCLIDCSKQRNGGWEGKIALWFDPASLQYLETETYGGYEYVNTAG